MEAKDLVFTKIKFLESTGDLPRSITRNDASMRSNFKDAVLSLGSAEEYEERLARF